MIFHKGHAVQQRLLSLGLVHMTLTLTLRIRETFLECGGLLNAFTFN